MAYKHNWMPAQPERIVISVRESLMKGEDSMYFDTEQEAAMAYDVSQIFQGEQPQNFPQYDYMGLFAKMLRAESANRNDSVRKK